MKLLAHRGMWNERISKNSPDALHRALENGYGVESDLRDYGGQLVISHNIADKQCQEAKNIFAWLQEFQDAYCFAINIKADGLLPLLMPILQEYGITNYFTFDMSVPQMLEYREAGARYFTRQSEIEPNPVLYEDATGVWVDGFFGDEWITGELVQGHLDRGKQVCLVSPELHGRKPQDFWKRVQTWHLDLSQVFLCTDLPSEASTLLSAQ